jgi:hypothetical protein
MKHSSMATGDQLANALHALGVNFLIGGKSSDNSLYSQPARLIADLAQSDEARLRLALIPLFLEHPEYASYVGTASKKLVPSAKLTLQCYYTAAIWLAKKYQIKGAPLPDLFSMELKLTPVDDPVENLRALARRHRELSGSFVNWLATYQHAEQVWRKGLEFREA